MIQETKVQPQVESYQRLKKWYLMLNTQHYKVRIKGKVEKSKECGSVPTLHLGVVASKKGASGSPSTKVTKFT